MGALVIIVGYVEGRWKSFKLSLGHFNLYSSKTELNRGFSRAVVGRCLCCLGRSNEPKMRKKALEINSLRKIFGEISLKCALLNVSNWISVKRVSHRVSNDWQQGWGGRRQWLVVKEKEAIYGKVREDNIGENGNRFWLTWIIFMKVLLSLS